MVDFVVVSKHRRQQLLLPIVLFHGHQFALQPFFIARSVAFLPLPELIPIDGPKIISILSLLNLRSGSGNGKSDQLSLRHRHIYKPLSQLVVGKRFIFHRIDHSEWVESASLGPNIISDGHHHRLRASCANAFVQLNPYKVQSRSHNPGAGERILLCKP